MRFVQYKRPGGRSSDIFIDVAPEVETAASSLWNGGWRFEAEVLPDGTVFLDCCNDDEELANAVVSNGPGMREAVERLVGDALVLTRGGHDGRGSTSRLRRRARGAAERRAD